MQCHQTYLRVEMATLSRESAGVLKGFIDLLFEEEDGLVVVDYKTDALEADQTLDAVFADPLGDDVSGSIQGIFGFLHP